MKCIKINSLQYQALLRKRLNPYLDLGWIRLKPLRSETLLIIVLIKKRRTRDELFLFSMATVEVPCLERLLSSCRQAEQTMAANIFSSAVQL